MIEFPGVANPAREGPQPQITARGRLFEAADGDGRGAGVLVLHPWWGLNDTILDFARNLSNEGFTALAPDLFDDGQPPATTIEQAEKRSSAAESEDDGVGVEQRVLGAADFLVERTGGPISVVGFSFGAGYALWLPKKRPDNIRAIVLYYGTGGPVTGNAPVLGHFAEDDPYESAENVDDLEKQLAEQGRDAQIHRYPGTHHWFAEPDRPEYTPAAAEQAWERTLAFLRQQTGA